MLAATLDVDESLERLTEPGRPAHGRLVHRPPARRPTGGCSGSRRATATERSSRCCAGSRSCSRPGCATARTPRGCCAGAPADAGRTSTRTCWPPASTTSELRRGLPRARRRAARWSSRCAPAARCSACWRCSPTAAAASYDEDDLVTAADLARRAALTVDNARLYQREHEVAEQLQRSLLPQLPDGARPRPLGALPARLDGRAGRRRLVRPVPRCPTARSASRSATSWATTWPPRRRWASCGRCCRATPGRAATPPSCSTGSTSSCRASTWPSSPTCAYGRLELPADGPARAAAPGQRRPPAARAAPPDGTVAAASPPSRRCSSAPRSAPTGRPSRRPSSRGSVLVLYTDGLVEHRGRGLDEGLQRAAARPSPPRPDDAQGDQRPPARRAGRRPRGRRGAAGAAGPVSGVL